MTIRSKRLLVYPSLMLLAVLVTAAAMPAGGFYLRVELPDASTNPALKEAVLVVRPDGCREPEKAKLTATAEGIVNGIRQTRQVRLRPVNEALYAVSRQWPSEGQWVLNFQGTYDGMTSSMMLLLGPEGAIATDVSAGAKGDQLPLRHAPRAFTEAEIARALADATRKGNDLALQPIGTP